MSETRHVIDLSDLYANITAAAEAALTSAITSSRHDTLWFACNPNRSFLRTLRAVKSATFIFRIVLGNAVKGQKG